MSTETVIKSASAEDNDCRVTHLRRRGRAIAAVAAIALGASCVAPAVSTASAASRHDQAAAIVAIARKAMSTYHLKAVILRVTVDNKPVVTRALGFSMTDVPATTAMHFRNNAVAFSYASTLLMEYVDAHKVKLSDKVARWLPRLPDAKRVTLKMLANMTSGYPDFATKPKFVTEFNDNPFQIFTARQRLALAFSPGRLSFPPGTNWGYAHTNYLILGQILAMVGHKPLATLLRQKVLVPLRLSNTVASQTSSIPSPILHAFAVRQSPIYEDSTFWNAASGTPPGATDTTNIYDMTATANGIGSGVLLSRSSYRAMTGPNLLGFGHPQPGCSCGKQTVFYNYGLGVVRSGSWVLQNPLFGGYGATEAYLPWKKIAIAVVVTFGPKAFDVQGNYSNSSDPIFRAIATRLAPHDPPQKAMG
jgi:CubicO group peptidase (beta-lactamase class C family)